MKKTLLTLILVFSILSAAVFGQRPVISSFSPASGPAGSSVVIKGSGFNPAAASNTVLFAGLRAVVNQASENELRITLPLAGGAGNFSVINNQNGLSVRSSGTFMATYSRVQQMYASDFETETKLKTKGPFLIAAFGDLDGNGRTDLVFGDRDLKEINIRLNTSRTDSINERSFAGTITISLPSQPQQAMVSDMNGDGRPDIIVREFSGYVVVYKNNSVPNQALKASSFERIECLKNVYFYSLGIGDLDGDGSPDLIGVNSSEVVVCKNQTTLYDFSTSSFAGLIKVPIQDPGRIVLEDMDGDGRLDVLLEGTNLTILHNQVVNGNLGADAMVPSKLNISPVMLVVGDIDGDGKKDLIAGDHFGKQLRVYRNTNAPGVLNAANFTLASAQYAADLKSLTVEDLDGDGRPDLAALAGRELLLFKNVRKTTGPWFERTMLYFYDNRPLSIHTADLNNDGMADLITCNAGDSTITIRKNKESLIPVISSFAPLMATSGSTVVIEGRNFGGIEHAKVKFGGRDAKMIAATANTLTVLVPAGSCNAAISVLNTVSKRTGSSAKKFKTLFDGKKDIDRSDFRLAHTLTGFTSAPYESAFAFNDMDEDGFIDLIYLDKDFHIAVRKNAGSTGRIDCRIFADPLIVDPVNTYEKFFIDDFDSDGLPDLVCRDQKGNGQFIKNASSGGKFSFLPASFIGADLPLSSVADLDGDGRIDLGLNRNVSSENTKGTAFRKSYDGFAGFAGFRDLDGDGKADGYADGNSYAERLKLYANIAAPGSVHPDSSFVLRGETKLEYFQYKFHDLDNDGLPEILFNSTTVLNKSRTGEAISFEKKQLIDYPVPPYAHVPPTLHFADLNGDGFDDLLISKPMNILDTLKIYQSRIGNDGLPKFEDYQKLVFNIYDENGFIYNPLIVGITDLNNDDKPDIIFWDGGRKGLYVVENVSRRLVPATAPNITSFQPSKGRPGEMIIIYGTNFNAAADKNLVYFGLVEAKVVSGSTSSLTVEVPAGAVYSEIAVLNSDTKLRTQSAEKFVLALDRPDEDFTASSFKLVPNIIPKKALTASFADIDGDADPEMLISGEPISIWKSRGTSNLNNPENFRQEWSSRSGLFVSAVDLDGDGRLDIINDSGDGVFIYENSRSLACNLKFAGLSLSLKTAVSTISGDVNNDGKIDILRLTQNGVVIVYLNDSKLGSISFLPFITVYVPVEPGLNRSTAFMLKDMDGDGLPDIMFSSESSGFKNGTYIYRNLSKAGSSELSFDKPFTFEGVFCMGLTADDLDGDQKPDLILTGDTGLKLYKNLSKSGQLAFAPVVIIKNSLVAFSVRTADLDGDGRPEIIAGDEISPGVTIFRNKAGNGNLSENSFAAVRYITPGGNRQVIVADFNKDGRADLILPSYGSANISLLQNYLSGNQVVTPVLIAKGNTTIVKGDSLELAVNPESGFVYKWTKDGQEISGVTSGRYWVKTSGTYQVSIDYGNVSSSSNRLTVNVNDFALPVNNFNILVTAAACKGVKNGSIGIKAVKAMDYIAVIKSAAVNLKLTFREQLLAENLAAGTYSVCLSVVGQDNYKKCYDVVVAEPKDLDVFAQVNEGESSVKLRLNGASLYHIEFNGKSITTAERVLTLTMVKGMNSLSVRGDTECQGVISKTFHLSEAIRVYPNPFERWVNINMAGDDAAEVKVQVVNAFGQVVYDKTHMAAQRQFAVDLDQLSSGLYLIRLKTPENSMVFKIKKK